MSYFYDGYRVGSKIENDLLQTQLPAGRDFSIGASDEDGTLTQLNIWDYEISTSSIIAMSAGGFNVHGSLLSWKNLRKYVPDENIKWNSEIYLPGRVLMVARVC